MLKFLHAYGQWGNFNRLSAGMGHTQCSLTWRFWDIWHWKVCVQNWILMNTVKHMRFEMQSCECNKICPFSNWYLFCWSINSMHLWDASLLPLYVYPTKLVQVQVRPVGTLSPWHCTSLRYRWDRWHPEVTDNHKYKEYAVMDSQLRVFLQL